MVLLSCLGGSEPMQFITWTPAKLLSCLGGSELPSLLQRLLPKLLSCLGGSERCLCRERKTE
ncbi:hypothetical protein THIOSC15_2340007 [uncultured Thiomicrorhabdus sp.]